MRRLGLLMLCFACLPAQSLVTATSLSDGTLYADQVARQVGDLVTIQIQETNSIKESSETETGRTNSGRLSGNWSKPSEDGGTSVSKVIPGISFQTDTGFEGEADYSNSGEIKATVTGRVIDVLANGNMVIEARRTLRFGSDSKTIVLSGIIRRDDVGPNNSVMSEKIHNFQVGIEGQGPLTRAQQRGWLGRLLDILWPL
jgi:flagellar L-ring protein FlgH